MKKKKIICNLMFCVVWLLMICILIFNIVINTVLFYLFMKMKIINNLNHINLLIKQEKKLINIKVYIN